MCSFLHVAPRFCFLNELERDLGRIGEVNTG